MISVPSGEAKPPTQLVTKFFCARDRRKMYIHVRVVEPTFWLGKIASGNQTWLAGKSPI